MKINRIYEIEGGAYGDCEVTIAFITGDLTYDKVKSILSQTSRGKSLCDCDMLETEIKNLLENKFNWFFVESGESDVYLK